MSLLIPPFLPALCSTHFTNFLASPILVQHKHHWWKKGPQLAFLHQRICLQTLASPYFLPLVFSELCHLGPWPLATSFVQCSDFTTVFLSGSFPQSKPSLSPASPGTEQGFPGKKLPSNFDLILSLPLKENTVKINCDFHRLSSGNLHSIYTHSRGPGRKAAILPLHGFGYLSAGDLASSIAS